VSVCYRCLPPYAPEPLQSAASGVLGSLNEAMQGLPGVKVPLPENLPTGSQVWWGKLYKFVIQLHLPHSLKAAWFQPLNLTCDFPVPKLVFKLVKLWPLRRGSSPRTWTAACASRAATAAASSSSPKCLSTSQPLSSLAGDS
jgi:hypothetical protein